MYRYEGSSLIFSILGLLTVFYLLVMFSPVMIFFLVLAIVGYGAYLFIQNSRNRKMFHKNEEQFDEKGRKITQATVLSITDDEEPSKKN
ncbi:MAG: hypothetical protein A2Y33_01820 [Spirochaetes bacterium GWF1_51_8]|nr:MAG: hypothetical protein A2Y33_01820 [Spirochaetes bacterium GWF1_51_8]